MRVFLSRPRMYLSWVGWNQSASQNLTIRSQPIKGSAIICVDISNASSNCLFADPSRPRTHRQPRSSTMPPKRRRSSVNPVTAPLPSPTSAGAAPPRSPSKIPRRKSTAGTTTATTAAPAHRRTSGIPRVTPRQSLAGEEALPKPTPHGDVSPS